MSTYLYTLRAAKYEAHRLSGPVAVHSYEYAGKLDFARTGRQNLAVSCATRVMEAYKPKYAALGLSDGDWCTGTPVYTNLRTAACYDTAGVPGDHCGWLYAKADGTMGLASYRIGYFRRADGTVESVSETPGSRNVKVITKLPLGRKADNTFHYA